ncbi:PREDICTED: transmembrane protein 141 isoform X4 [Hipposideros armiger]|uniref:Transmembrane protein 141 isoform X4 n=1 Tax=Hipposideros armiger TaxID=186990 RepID=A0A8B7R7C0_HIPAR|nr:PREDICTED: transmembrane protein 141 isoform X4 [Hipposideros armiger]
MVNLGLSRVDDAVAAKHPVGWVQVSSGVETSTSRWCQLSCLQAPEQPWACRCSLRGSLSTPFSGTCWWPWISAAKRAPAKAQKTWGQRVLEHRPQCLHIPGQSSPLTLALPAP